jgi:hypothetical protein
MKISLGRLIISLVIISSVVILTSKPSKALVPLNVDAVKNQFTKVDTWAIKCGTIKSKGEDKISKFEKNYDKHYQIYIKLYDRLEAKISEWEGKGYDVDQLKEDLKTMKEKVDKYNTDYKTYMDKLDVIKAIDCDKTETDLSNALKDARNALKEVRKDVVDIKTFYWSTVRQHIMDLKKQIIQGTED